jgi:class 3 adenylate cyclase/tetratricopeptide (TPR) repeat protein
LPEYLEALLTATSAYLPRTLVRPLLTKPDGELLIYPLEGTVMFADIDGFVRLAERFSEVAPEEGAEELTRVVNRFLEILITVTGRHDGDLQKFGGDAGLLLFTGEGHVERAVAASLEVQRAMVERMALVETSVGTYPLHVAVGLASGPMVGVGLGTPHAREWIIAGPPVNAVGHVQGAAPAGGVAVPGELLPLCPEGTSVKPLRGGFRQVLSLPERPVSHVSAPTLPSPEGLEGVERLKWYLSRLDVLTPYLTSGLLQRLIATSKAEDVRSWSEHRQVTILMLALEGPTGFGEMVGDPQALRDAVVAFNGRFVRACDVIRLYDGVVNKIGVGPQGAYLMVLFGAPSIHEDDPLRAVLAALELQRDADLPLFSVGINTGNVFAGDVGGAGRREYTVMGDEVNFAYRLMSACPAGEVWLGPNASRHTSVAGRVIGDRLDARRFKGKREVIAPFVVEGLRRHFLGAPSAELPLVDRAEELGRLLEVLEEMEGGECPARIVLLAGEAGVGKSRLAQELVARAEEQGIAPHVGVAPSYGRHLPYASWEGALTSLLNLNPSEGLSERRAAFLATLRDYEVEVWAALLAPLVGLDVPPSPEVSALTAEARAGRRTAALRELLAKAARERPRLLLLEDVHWMSPPSLDLLDALLADPPRAPLMTLVTYRPEGPVVDRWEDLKGLEHLCLMPLSQRHTLQLLGEVAGGLEIPDAVKEWVLERGGGLPLFAREALQTLIASGALTREGEGWVLARSLEEMPLPSTVYALIQSRIDQLEPPTRHLLRAAAVIGDQMSLPMLVAGYGEEPQSVVQRRLSGLAPLGLVKDEEGEGRMTFRQPLVREVAYRGLPHRMQRLIHQRTAHYLALHQEDESGWTTLVAHHAYEGHLWQQAMETNLELGRRALGAYLAGQAQFALERALHSADAGDLPAPEVRFEALHLLTEALSLQGDYEGALVRLQEARRLAPLRPTGPEEVGRLAHLEYHTASVLETLGRYPRAFAALERGLGLEGVEQTVEGARLYSMQAGLHFRQGNLDEAYQALQRSVAAAESLGAEDAAPVLARALYLLAYITARQGNPDEALVLAERSLEIYEEVQDLLGEMNTRNNLLLINLGQGRWDDAVVHGERAYAIARRIRHIEGQARVIANLGEVYRYQGRYADARRAYGTALAIAQQAGIKFGEALMENNLAAVALKEGAWEEAERHLQRAVHLFAEISSVEMLPELYRSRSELHLRQGRPEAALEWARRSLQQAEAQGVGREAGRTQGVLAEIYLALGDYEEARKSGQEALDAASRAQDRYGVACGRLIDARVRYHAGDPSVALSELREAVRELEALGAAEDLRQARALLEKWECLRDPQGGGAG